MFRNGREKYIKSFFLRLCWHRKENIYNDIQFVIFNTFFHSATKTIWINTKKLKDVTSHSVSRKILLKISSHKFINKQKNFFQSFIPFTDTVSEWILPIHSIRKYFINRRNIILSRPYILQFSIHLFLLSQSTSRVR